MSFGLFLALLVGGMVTGTIGGLLGIGGGVFLIPFLVLVLGLPIHQAIATSIVAVIATSSAGAVMNLERGLVNVRLGMLLETATVFGAILGGLTANYLSGQVLARIFSVLLLIVAVLMIWQTHRRPRGAVVVTDGSLPASFEDEASGNRISYDVQRVPAVMFVSLIAGNVSGLLGVGGGIFKVPAMTMLSGIPMKAAVATSNFMIGVTAAASAFIYFSHGHVQPIVVSTTALGVLAGSFLGIQINKRIQAAQLSWLFALLLIAVSLYMYLRN